MVGLEDVRGYSANDAQRSLQQQGFAVTLARRYDNTLRDTVIEQRPAAGAKVPEGSRITLIVSDGPAPIVVSDFVGMPVNKAQARAAALGIVLDTSQTVAGNPANTVASQNVPPGTKVSANATVRVVVNSGVPVNAPPAVNGPPATIPNLMGAPYGPAIDTLKSAGLSYSVHYAVQSTNNGTIVAQDPQPGPGTAGAAVTITLSVSGEVPDTEGLPPDRAQAILAADGYSVARWQYTTALGEGGKVVGTEPQAGTDLAPGSSVTSSLTGRRRNRIDAHSWDRSGAARHRLRRDRASRWLAPFGRSRRRRA